MKQHDNRWRTNPELWEKLKPIADEKRHNPTEAENELWKRIRKHQLQGLKFRRQHSLGPFIVDFYCKDAKLVIEVDGPIHQRQVKEDAIRQGYLESLKLKVIRFTNDMVMNDITEVMKQIENSLPGTL
jgi:very-short-patch-repair endonuclease